MKWLSATRPDQPTKPLVQLAGVAGNANETEIWRPKIFEEVATYRFSGLHNSDTGNLLMRWLRNDRWLGARPRHRAERYAVAQAMRDYTRTEMVAERSGRQEWQVAQDSLICASAVDGPFDGELHDGLETRLLGHLQDNLKGLFDPEKGISVRCVTSVTLPKEKVLIFLGEHVFAPRSDAVPVGSLTLQIDGAAQVSRTEPLLLNGEPGALYSGQSVVGFALRGQGDSILSPVELDLGFPNSYSCFLSVRADKSKNPEFPFRVDRYQGPGGKALPRFTPVQPTEPCDAEWKVLFFGEADTQEGRLRLILDKRSSRLHVNRPEKAENQRIVEIVGIDLTPDLLARPAERVWFEMTPERTLRHSSLQAKSMSLVWMSDGSRAYRYDWADYQIRGDAKSGLAPSPGGGVRLGPTWTGGSLGYLRVPDVDQRLRYSPEWAPDEGYHVDWLNSAAVVDFGDRRIGLADAIHEAGTGADLIGPDLIVRLQTAGGPIKVGPFLLSLP